MQKYLLYIICFLLAACVSEPRKKSSQGKITLIRQPVIEQTTCPDVGCFKAKILQKGKATRSELDYFFDNVQYKENIINVMNKSGTASSSWYVFRQNNVSNTTIRQGINFYERYKAVIDDISQKSGIPSEYIIAILGIETRYGELTGKYRVADTLYTLAFYHPKRQTLFQKELEEFLLMSKEANRDPFTYRGSFAGAMGYTQFLPSSYRQWAVSYSGQKFPDIWSKAEDAIASVANYLQQHGWERGSAVSYPVSLAMNNELQAIIDEKTSLNYRVSDLKAKGVNFYSPLADDTPVVLYRLEISPGVYAYFVGLKNFYTIWTYNNSRLYVMAVEEIARGIREGIH